MVIVQRLLHIGKSPISGMLYTREALERLLEHHKLKTTPVMVEVSRNEINYNHNTFQVDLENVAGFIEDMYLDDEGLIVHIKLLETPMGLEISKLLNIDENDGVVNNHTLRVSPNMSGSTEILEDRTVVVTNLELHSIRFEPK